MDLCSGIDGVEFGDSETSWSSEVSLATTAMQEICAQTEDEAGNVAEARVAIRFNTTAPQLEIASPADGAAFNIAGDSTHTADLVSGNDTCEVAFDVLCTGVDDDVELVRESNDAVLATATCVADAGAPAPYAGRATFAMASLPSFDDGSALRVVARQTSDRLTGESAPISVTSDCVAPPVVITQPMCGACLLYTSPSPRDGLLSRMPSSA